MTRPALHFAYGSNLSSEDWARFCARCGCGPELLEPVGPAFLPDRELRFTRWSVTRQGGVLDVVPRRGQLTDGWLFRVRDPRGWELLDRKEGAPGAYRRVVGIALTPEGRQRRVQFYEVREPEPFVPPTGEYLGLVRDARVRRGLSVAALDAAAEDRAVEWFTERLFVYGTLLQGEALHPAIVEGGARAIVPATTRGTLLDFGEWPGLVPHADGVVIAGECVVAEDVARMVPVIDEVEGFFGWGVRGSVFRRALVDTSEGQAWAWVPVRVAEGVPVASGSWRVHRGRT